MKNTFKYNNKEEFINDVKILIVTNFKQKI
jgi:hypothetical protein